MWCHRLTTRQPNGTLEGVSHRDHQADRLKDQNTEKDQSCVIKVTLEQAEFPHDEKRG